MSCQLKLKRFEFQCRFLASWFEVQSCRFFLSFSRRASFLSSSWVHACDRIRSEGNLSSSRPCYCSMSSRPWWAVFPSSLPLSWPWSFRWSSSFVKLFCTVLFESLLLLPFLPSQGNPLRYKRLGVPLHSLQLRFPSIQLEKAYIRWKLLFSSLEATLSSLSLSLPISFPRSVVANRYPCSFVHSWHNQFLVLCPGSGQVGFSGY